jgi:hypothetical protein
MKTNVILTFTTLFALTACGAGGAVGDTCTTDADCADGLECHIEEHEEETHEEEEHEDHVEEGTCEDSHEEHDH